MKRNLLLFLLISVNAIYGQVTVERSTDPIILVHGLNSSDSGAWSETKMIMQSYGLSYGGTFNACLNYDGNWYKANQKFYPDSGADIRMFDSSLVKADVYAVNFNVGLDGSTTPSGSNNVHSNQSAIAKQGAVLKKVIAKVLEITGKQKVILMGHSMGGLASREYLENASLYQNDGKHHVSKLVTLCTPHGGSNMSGWGFEGILGINEQNEAVRDLRTDYYYSQEPGVYLFGGKEIQDGTHCSNFYFKKYYNVDFNANGIEGETIVGLNQKPIPSDVEYTSVIGRKSVSDPNVGDGVVAEYSANLNNFKSNSTVAVKEIVYQEISSSASIHSNPPKVDWVVGAVIDESDSFDKAKVILPNQSYVGMVNLQGEAKYTTNRTDVDMFKINVAGATVMSFANIGTENCYVGVYDKNRKLLNVYSNYDASDRNSLKFTLNNSGEYFLSVLNQFETTSNRTYLFSSVSSVIASRLSTDDAMDSEGDMMFMYPNPVLDKVNFGAVVDVKVFDVNGRLLKDVQQVNGLDVSDLNTGTYLVKMQLNGVEKVMKLVKE